MVQLECILVVAYTSKNEKVVQRCSNPNWNAKINNLIFHSREVVFRYRNPQRQVIENDRYLFNLR